MKPFLNPYATLGRSDSKVVSFEVSKPDYYLIKSIRPEQGTMAAVLGILWQKLCYELRKRNIADYTNIAEFEQFIANCTIVPESEGSGVGGRLPDSTTGRTDEPGNVPQDERRGETTSGSLPPTASPVVSNVQKRDRARRKDASSEKGQGEGKP